jgi:hypothetical protein
MKRVNTADERLKVNRARLNTCTAGSVISAHMTRSFPAAVADSCIILATIQEKFVDCDGAGRLRDMAQITEGRYGVTGGGRVQPP